MRGSRDQIDAPIAQNFIRTFINTYKSHGGRVGNANPVITNGPPDIAVAVETLHNKLVAQCEIPSEHQNVPQR
jgi:hypothetical protein